ncbi:hypothetical protein EDD15DRAFT_2192809 [Pisolithus albus]|nr:hypothetical protein EDD15DRAFT_2192809 [Pisolithus albus]
MPPWLLFALEVPHHCIIGMWIWVPGIGSPVDSCPLLNGSKCVSDSHTGTASVNLGGQPGVKFQSRSDVTAACLYASVSALSQKNPHAFVVPRDENQVDEKTLRVGAGTVTDDTPG